MKATAESCMQSIEGAPLPTTSMATRDRPLKERSALIRGLLRQAGVKGVKVTSADGAFCDLTDITITVDFRPESRERILAVRKKTEAMVLAAFPDLGDRSDARSDCFDSKFAVKEVPEAW
jgi:hypothetical protein